MRHYELVAILSPMLNQDEATSAWADIKSFIGNRDGEITAEQIWGTRRLAYPIRKGSFNFLEGSYYLSSFAVESAFNKELETYLRLDERVLRSLVIRCDGPLEDRPAPGPLTAPSRYIPPGRGRRPDGGGPIPEAPGGSPDRRPEPAFAPPVAASPAVAGTPAAPDAPAPLADAPAPRERRSAGRSRCAGPADRRCAGPAERRCAGRSRCAGPAERRCRPLPMRRPRRARSADAPAPAPLTADAPAAPDAGPAERRSAGRCRRRADGHSNIRTGSGG